MSNGNGKDRAPDPFDDLDSFRLPPGAVVAPAPTEQSPKSNRVRARAGFAGGFVQVPQLWKDLLKGASGAVYGLVLALDAESHQAPPPRRQALTPL